MNRTAPPWITALHRQGEAGGKGKGTGTGTGAPKARRRAGVLGPGCPSATRPTHATARTTNARIA